MNVVFLVSLVSFSWAFPSPSRKPKLQDSLKQELVPIQIILDQNHARRKRSTNFFPDKMLFTFSTSDGDFRLDLVRNDLVKVPPVLLWNGEQVTNDTAFDLQRDFALYQGSAMGANALVRFPNDDFTKFELHANYIIGTEFYSIEPVTSRTRRSAVKIVEPPFSKTTPHPATIRIHNVLRLEKDSLDFENDMFIIKSDPSQTDELKLQRVVEGTSGPHNTAPFVTDFGTIHIDTRFKTAQTPQGDLRVAIAGIVLAMDRMSSNWTENNVISGNKVNDGNTLMDFAIWSNSQKSRLPRHDHAALYTGYNLAETSTDDRTIGIAYLSRVCNSYAASVNEETFNAIAIHIGSHELGHSIGASHDTGACPSRNFNLMAGILPNPANLSPDMALNTFKFSSCSRAAIGNYVSGLLENCLSNIPPYLDVVSRESQAFTADEQCALTYAPSTGSTVCRETYLGTILKWSEICHKLRCRIPGSTSCSAHFTFDGTPCGNYKWCQQGQCISSTKAQDVPDICPIGDDPSYNCNASLCSQYSPSVREGSCCQTCLIGTTTISTPITTTTPLTTTTPTTTVMPTTTTSSKTTTTPTTTTTLMTTTTPLSSTTSTTAYSTITTPTTTTTTSTTTTPSTTTPKTTTTTTSGLTTNPTITTPTITTSSTTTKTPSMTTTTTTSTTMTRMMTTLTTTTTTNPITMTRMTSETTAIPATSTTVMMSTVTKLTDTTPNVTKPITPTMASTTLQTNASMTSTTRILTSGISTTTALPPTANTQTTTTLQPKKTSATYSMTVTPSTTMTTTSSISASALPVTSPTITQLPTNMSSTTSIATKAPQMSTSATTSSGALTTKMAVPTSTFESITTKTSPFVTTAVKTTTEQTTYEKTTGSHTNTSTPLTALKTTTTIPPQSSSVDPQSSTFQSTEGITTSATTSHIPASAKSTATTVTAKQSTLATSSSTAPSTTLETSTTALPESSTSKKIHSSTSLSTTNTPSGTTTNSSIDTKETTRSTKTTEQPIVKTTTDSSDDAIINFMQQANFYHLTKIALFQALVANL